MDDGFASRLKPCPPGREAVLRRRLRAKAFELPALPGWWWWRDEISRFHAMIDFMLNGLKARFEREKFLTTWLAILISPVYFIRNGIYKSVKRVAPRIEGDILDFGCGSKPYES